MSFFDVLEEDENDIFSGSPKSKFFDVVNNANSEIVQEEIDKIIEKLAVLEMMLGKNKDLDEEIKKYKFDNLEEIKTMKKSLYIEFSGEIISRLDS